MKLVAAALIGCVEAVAETVLRERGARLIEFQAEVDAEIDVRGFQDVAGVNRHRRPDLSGTPAFALIGLVTSVTITWMAWNWLHHTG